MKKIPLLLIGGGGHCRSCIDVIEATQQFDIVGIVEADGVTPDTLNPYPCIGHDADLPSLLQTTPHCLITVGQVKSATVRQNLFNQLTQLGAVFPSIIGERCLIGSNTVVKQGVSISDNTIIGAGSVVLETIHTAGVYMGVIK
jgi:acetyltransferase-like isoleucine patch superfamily enzyme